MVYLFVDGYKWRVDSLQMFQITMFCINNISLVFELLEISLVIKELLKFNLLVISNIRYD